jgi:N-acetylglucosaminyldiphosphoundecaprenol N-acetyl-beta-D-mannosaminyltransferase
MDGVGEVQGESLCGMRVDALDLNGLLGLIAQSARTRAKAVILNHNLHSLYLYWTHPEFRAAYGLATAVYVDGMPVIWLARAAGLAFTAEHRVTFLDSFEAILAEAERRGWRVFYLGSTAETLARGLAILRRKFPALEIEGHHGHLQPGACGEVLRRIHECRPDVLFVGMGMPLQESWLRHHYGKLDVPAVLTSGATMDYVAGSTYKPPAWASRLGLYGVLRMMADPRRLWRRYLVEPVWLMRRMVPGIVAQRWRRGGVRAATMVEGA